MNQNTRMPGLSAIRSGRLPHLVTAEPPRTASEAVREALVAFFGARAKQFEADGVVDIPQALLDEAGALGALHDLEDQALAVVMGRYPAQAAA